ncbi:antibiotic biosynthesis monooxygenase [uncultured Roseobacter sp.]|uniref:antibiotic biosynthesis monooxygenase n=1 Tax=uncultured Roseobacter sp. TaxID=114847 RepID=UPI0026188BAD|nr:antibiotic biosynthesis monooxygenase [uncultured Roseobacter sp.]
MSTPDTAVTALIISHVRPGHEDAPDAKIADILALASKADGYLGSSVLRGTQGGQPQLYVVLHFATRAAWAAWRETPQAQPLLEDALQHVSEAPEVKLADGFAGWFDLPAAPMPVVPAKWKMAVVTWLAIFPILSVFLTGTAPLMGDLHPIGRLFLNTPIIVPLMTWLIMPGMTHLFRRWLFQSHAT